MKRIALVLFAMCAAASALAAPNATIQYCDNNRNAAVQQSMNQMNLVLPGLVDSQVGPSVDEYMRTNGIPRVITNTVVEVDVQVFSNITSDVVFHTNIIDNVISNYYHTNYIDNVISNYYYTNYTVNVQSNIVQNDYYTTNYNTVITHEVHYSTEIVTGEVYNVSITNRIDVNATITNGATYYVASLSTNTAISGDLNVYTSVKSRDFIDNKYWKTLIDENSGDVFVYKSTYQSTAVADYYRYQRVGGPTTTTGSSSALRYLGGINIYRNNSSYTIYVYNDSGTQTASANNLSASTINDGGYWTVGTRKVFAPEHVEVIGTVVDKLVTTSMLDNASSGDVYDDILKSRYRYEQPYFLYSTNGSFEALSGDRGVYSVSYPEYDSTNHKWPSIVDLTTGIEYVYKDTDTSVNYNRASIRYIRKEYAESGATLPQTGVYQSLVSYYYGGLTMIWDSSYNEFIVGIFEKDGTVRNAKFYHGSNNVWDTSNLYPEMLNNGGYWKLPYSILALPATPVKKKDGLVSHSEIKYVAPGMWYAKPYISMFDSSTKILNNDLTITTNTPSLYQIENDIYPMIYTVSPGELFVYAGEIITNSTSLADSGIKKQIPYKSIKNIFSKRNVYSSGLVLFEGGMTIAFMKRISSSLGVNLYTCAGITNTYTVGQQVRFKFWKFYETESANSSFLNSYVPRSATSLYDGALYPSTTHDDTFIRNSTITALKIPGESQEVIDYVPTWNYITNWVERNFQRK